MLETGLS